MAYRGNNNKVTLLYPIVNDEQKHYLSEVEVFVAITIQELESKLPANVSVADLQ